MASWPKYDVKWNTESILKNSCRPHVQKWIYCTDCKVVIFGNDQIFWTALLLTLLDKKGEKEDSS